MYYVTSKTHKQFFVECCLWRMSVRCLRCMRVHSIQCLCACAGVWCVCSCAIGIEMKCVVYPLLNPDKKSKLSLFIKDQDYLSKQLFRLGGGCVGAGGSGGQRAAQQRGFLRNLWPDPHTPSHTPSIAGLHVKERNLPTFFMYFSSCISCYPQITSLQFS